MNLVKSLQLTLKPNQQIISQQITFLLDGLCYISIEGSALFSYEFHCIDTDVHYSDSPILCNRRKDLLPFGSYKGRIFSFDFGNKSYEENHINLKARFERQPHSSKSHSFREYTLAGLNVKTPIELEPNKEVGIALTNYRGGHYEVHEIYSPQHKNLFFKIEYHGTEEFHLDGVYHFRRPWILRWPDSARVFLRNEGSSKFVVYLTEIYFAGYLLKPTDVIKTVAPINSRNSFLIEGIRLG